MPPLLPTTIVALTFLSGCIELAGAAAANIAVSSVGRQNQIEETPAESKAAEQKRQLENAAARATTDRLTWERESAAKARSKLSNAPVDAVFDVRPASSSVSETLDAKMIQEGIGAVKSTVMSCGSKSSVTGQVWVSLTVAPDGHALSVTVNRTPHSALGRCVANAVQEATFSKTQRGGTFRYPFVFRHDERRPDD